MNILFFIAIISAVGGALLNIYRILKYKKTTYYKITKTPYSHMDKGTRGEYLIYDSLRHFEDNGCQFLFNIYLPKGSNETTEIDLLLITPSGVLVFESKNYNGWIFGNEAHRYWTQTLPLGIGHSHKERFYNPVKQNASHITHLRPLIGDHIPVWSVIVFSDQCTLKDITLRSSRVRVINRHDVASVVSQICREIQANPLAEEEMNDIYNTLYPYTQSTAEIREQHAENVKRSNPRL